MKVVGIVAEYNPFHNGHLYQIEKAKELTGADYVIAVMSGDFVQRGTPAIIDKYSRTQMALLGGIDLVLELPCIYATGSAEYFAEAAVALLDGLGIVDLLCFGSESGDLPRLTQIAHILHEEPAAYQTLLKANLKTGQSFPLARSNALTQYMKTTSASLLSLPNNILGIEYLKALQKLHSPIRPFTIQRITAAYHEEQVNETISSATALRKALLTNTTPDQLTSLPPSSRSILAQQYHQTCPITEDHFSSLLKYKLLTTPDLSPYQDVGPDLSDRIRKLFCLDDTFTTLAHHIKAKHLPHTRINRSLLHILLSITESEVTSYRQNGPIHYARILGFRQQSAPLLSRLRTTSCIPLINKLADARHKLPPLAQSLLTKDIEASHLYQMITSDLYHHPLPNEYQHTVLRV